MYYSNRICLLGILMLFLGACTSNLKRDVHDLQARADDQAHSIAELQLQQADTIAVMHSVIAAQAATQSALQALQASQSAQDAQIAVLQASLVALQTQETSLQLSINTHTAQLALLNGYKNIIGYINPCGDQAGIIDEVLLQLSDGSLLASFSDNAAGKNTRFAIVPPGSYVDTDGSNCAFVVHSDNSITW